MTTIKALFEANLLLVLATFFLFGIILLIWNIFLHLSLRKIQATNREFWKGEKVRNLEEVLLDQAKNLKVLDKDIQELYTISNEINNLALRGIHKVSAIRFNPFKDVGGNQSFSIALLNGKNNGITITALYTKEGTRVYAKAITAGESLAFPLTDEEKEAIKTALLAEDKKKK
ncbi:MAG: DUF4446 family protein [Candidatus Moranbacteria bacterium]|nr:DUF4446 family protein [Candidatus Moranbacteria bacterium]